MKNATEKYLMVGDIVKGKTHEYKMTVEQVDEKTTNCVYFDKNQNIHRVIYNTNDLELINR
mgnify:CR=1 FL=1